MDDVLKWIEAHPAMSAVIGVGGAVVLLYLFGFFSSSQQSGSSGQSNLAAAYYAAEAAQTTAGTELNMVQANDQAATAQTLIQANAATSINAANDTMYTTLGNQNLQGNQTLYNDEMITSNTSANDAYATSVNTNATQLASTQASLQASELNNYVNTVFPTELSQQTTSGAQGFVAATPFGSFNINTGGFAPNINDLIGMGYTPSEAQQLAGV